MELLTPSDDMASGQFPIRGRCVCGGISFVVDGDLRPVVYCHCTMCRRLVGHFVAATACVRTDLTMLSDRTLRWFRSSDSARRGFCGECGSNVFWDPVGEPRISIMAGSLDKPTRLIASGHIFVSEAGDYYRIDDGLPQSHTWGIDLSVPKS